MIQQTIDTWFSNASLGGGNSNYVFFTPNLGEDEPILTSIFFKRVETTNQIKSSEHGIGGGGGGNSAMGIWYICVLQRVG